jgi:hypothetical protein
MSFKMAVDAAAKYLSIQIPGRGKATYTKHFASGVLVLKPVYIGVQKSELRYDRIHANADGVRGSGKRVWRYFPRIEDWAADVEFNVYDEAEAGKFIGIGRFRPQNGGFYGRFSVDQIKWSEI